MGLEAGPIDVVARIPGQTENRRRIRVGIAVDPAFHALDVGPHVESQSPFPEIAEIADFLDMQPLRGGLVSRYDEGNGVAEQRQHAKRTGKIFRAVAYIGEHLEQGRQAR